MWNGSLIRKTTTTLPLELWAEDLASLPKSKLKNRSEGIVSTIFRTDRMIARSFLRIGKSLVTGCGSNDKLISLNDLDTLLMDIGKDFFLHLFMSITRKPHNLVPFHTTSHHNRHHFLFFGAILTVF